MKTKQARNKTIKRRQAKSTSAKPITSTSKIKSKKAKELYTPYFEVAERKQINLNLIDDCPHNKRRFIKEKEMQELAANIKVYGIIQDIGVCPKEDGRYMLVYGRRRKTAALIAGLKEIWVKCASIPEDVLKEIIISENIHRESPHPIDEALLIGGMMEDRKTVEQIALRLGKSKSFVLSRSKLLSLIEPFQEMFYADKITIQDALQIALLPADSQESFFAYQCADWREDEDFELPDLDYALRRYQYNLDHAPFDTKNKQLNPAVGACTSCQFNTATLTSLFPDQDKNAICTNKNCYTQKCAAHAAIELKLVFEKEKPQWLIINQNVFEANRQLIESIPGAIDLPRYQQHEISEITPPDEPEKEDYAEEAEDKLREFDDPGYQAAVEEYQEGLNDFNQRLENGIIGKGIQLTPSGIYTGFYEVRSTDEPVTIQQKMTAKEVQVAIKQNLATPDLLAAELVRLQERKARALEIVEEKIQLELHSKFVEYAGDISKHIEFTAADRTASRIIIYNGISYSLKSQVNEALGIPASPTKQQLYIVLSRLNELQDAYLIRMAFVDKSEARYINNVTGFSLAELANSAGMDVDALREPFDKAAKQKDKTYSQRISDLQKRVARTQPKSE